MTRKAKERLSPRITQLFDAMNSGANEFTLRSLQSAMSDAETVRAAEVLKFKQAAFQRAVELGPQVWLNWDFVKDHFFWTPIEPSADVYAALIYPRAKTWARGRTLLQRAAQYRLCVSFRAMSLPPDDLDKVLKHELVHMGYSGHGADFRAVCREVGGTVSGAGVDSGDDGIFFEQRQPNGRYARVGPRFSTEAEAEAWFKDQTQVQARIDQANAWLAANPGKTKRDVIKALMWRLTYL